ncbi:MAG: glycosyltransferase family 2 protein [Synechococcales bacterium]|nr:glycosyltransferase family 2 protein [Synechococcales bacterium]
MQHHDSTAPLISVVIPAYNAETTILETIASVQAQTFSDFEIIVINDGSTDSTLQLLEGLNDDRLRVTSYPNGGLSVARNRGMALARGEFIAFLDADDLWTPDKLELQLKALQANPKAGVVYSWTHFMDDDGNLYRVNPSDPPLQFEGNVFADLLTWNFIASGSNPMVRKEAILATGEFKTAAGGAADWDYWLRLALNWDYVVVPQRQILYRLTSGSMSSKIEQMEQCQITVMEDIFELAPPELQHLKRKTLSYIYRNSVKFYLERSSSANRADLALEKLVKSIQTFPKALLFHSTQKLFVKIALVKTLPSSISFYLFHKANRVLSS